MALKMYTDPIHKQSLLEAAQKGNSDAIASLLQQTLASEDITVNTHITQSQLDIVLKETTDSGSRTHPEWILSFIQQSIRHLQPQNITMVQITWHAASDTSSSEQDINLAPCPIMPPINIEALSNQDMQATVEQFAPPKSPDQALSQAHLTIGHYANQWTPKGILVTAQPSAKASWEKRLKVDSAYVCPPITRLLNHQTELKAAISTLQAGGAIEFSGEAGSGKTALLRAICHHPQLLTRFPGGIIYQQAYQQPFEDLMQTLFDAVYQERNTALSTSSQEGYNSSSRRQHKPTPLDLKQHLSQHQLCLVLDEMETSTQALQEWSQWLGLSLLVAKNKTLTKESKRRQQEGKTNTRNLPVKGLPLKDAVVLFEEGLERSLQPREEKEAEKLCAHLGGHPRRLIQMAALIRNRQASLSELVQQLRQGTVPEAIILKSVSSLPESDRRVIAILASFSGIPVHGLHLPPLADLDSVTDQLKTLVAQGLVCAEGHSYRLADNLRAPLQQHWNLTPWVDQALIYFKRWLGQFSANKEEHAWNSIDYTSSTVEPILQNSETLWYLLCHAMQHQKWSDVLELSLLMEPGLWLGQRWGRWQQVLIAQWNAARTLQDKHIEAKVLHQLGSRALCLEDGLTAHACLAQALNYRMELGDVEGASLSQHNFTLLAQAPFAIERFSHADQNQEVKNQGQLTNQRPVETLGTDQPIAQIQAPINPVMINQVTNNQTEATSQPPTPPKSPSPEADDPKEPEKPPSTTSPETSASEPESAVLSTSAKWIPWLWALVSAGSLVIIGLVAFFLGKEPATNISKLRSKHTFPPQRLGVKSEPHKFTITNTDSSSITIDVTFSEGDRQDFSLNSDDCTSESLPANDTCVLTATFEPQSIGPRASSFFVQVGKNNTPKPLTLQGIGAAVQAETQPFEVPFGDQVIAQRSETKAITFHNKGTVAFMVQGSNLINNEANAFFVERDTCSGQVLQPRDDCRLTVSFLPPDATNYRSVLEIVDDTGKEIWRIPLMGEGIHPPRPAPSPQTQRLRGSQPSNQSSPRNTQPTPINPTSPTEPKPYQFGIRPGTIDFDAHELNSTTTRTLRIQNEGSMNLELTALTIEDSTHFAVTDDSCLGTRILPGNECIAAIAFTPATAQEYTTTFTVTSAQAGTQTMNIRGNGIPALEPTDPNGIDNIDTDPPSINAFSGVPNTVAPNDSVELCYDLSGTSKAHILNRSTGAEIAISPNTPGCVSQTIADTTTYSLIAFQDNYEPVERSVTITVADRDPPPTPVAIAPTASHPIYCNSPVTLEWQPVTDDNGPVSYGINLQRQDVSTNDTGAVNSSSAWTPMSTRTSNQTSLSISGAVQAPNVYRWQVQSVDTAGNTSPPSGWNEFWCINP